MANFRGASIGQWGTQRGKHLFERQLCSSIVTDGDVIPLALLDRQRDPHQSGCHLVGGGGLGVEGNGRGGVQYLNQRGQFDGCIHYGHVQARLRTGPWVCRQYLKRFLPEQIHLLRPTWGNSAGQLAELVHQRTKLQLAEQGLHFSRIEGVRFGLFEVERNRQIGSNGSEIAAHGCGCFPCFQLGPPARLDLVQMSIDVIKGGILGKQVFGSLLTHARHARDVVRLVADDGLVVYHLLRADTKLAYHILGGDVVLLVARQINDCALVHEL